MKLPVRPLLIILLGVVLLFGTTRTIHVHPTPQQRVEHMLNFQTANNKDFGECTGTAVGPHAILTAEHCNDRYTGKGTQILLDESMRHYHILGAIGDNQDHVIFLLDGPPLKNFVDISKLVDVAPPRPGEHLVIYGDGMREFPPKRRDGKVDLLEQEEDSSDVDADLGMTYYTMEVIPGDSGSAVFGEDGRIVGIITYSTECTTHHSEGSAGFPLAYSRQALEQIQAFSLDDMLPSFGKTFK